jgi:hypothetical protein
MADGDFSRTDGDDVYELIDAAVMGVYSERARLFTYAATSRSADKAGFDELMDGIALRAGGGNDAALELLLELVLDLHLADPGSTPSRVTKPSWRCVAVCRSPPPTRSRRRSGGSPRSSPTK